MELTRRLRTAAEQRQLNTDAVTSIATELISANARFGTLLAWMVLRKSSDPACARIMTYAVAAQQVHPEQVGVLMDVVRGAEYDDPSTLVNTITILDQRLGEAQLEAFLAPGLASFLTRCLASDDSVQDAAIEFLVHLLETSPAFVNEAQLELLRGALSQIGERRTSDPFARDFERIRGFLSEHRTAAWFASTAELSALVNGLRNDIASVRPAEAGLLLREAVGCLGSHLEHSESALSAGRSSRAIQSVRMAKDRERPVALSAIAAISDAWRALFQSAAEALDDSAELFGVAASPGSFVLRISVEDVSDAALVFEHIRKLIAEGAGRQLQGALQELAISASKYRDLLESLCGDGVQLDVVQFDPRRDSFSAPVTLTPDQAEGRVRSVRTYLSAHLDTSDIPQADELTRVFTLLQTLESGREPTPERLEVTSRQVNYYRHAARVLGYLTEENTLTSAGEQVSKMDHDDQLAATAVRFEGSRVGAAWIHWSRGRTLADVTPETALQFLTDSVPALSESTAERRSKTLRAWLTELLPHHYATPRQA